MALTLLAHVALARWMDASAYGQYNFAVTVAVVFAVIAQLGLDQAILTFLPRYVSVGLFHVVRDYLSFSLKVGVLFGGTLALLLAAMFPVFGVASMSDTEAWWTVLILPTGGILFLQQAFRAFKSFRLAQTFEQTVFPIGLLVVGVGLHCLNWLTFEALIAWHGAIAFIGCAVLAKGILKQVSNASTVSLPDHPVPRRSEWVKVGIPLAVASLMSLLLARADILVLGILRPAPELAAYAVAVRLSSVLILGLYAADMVVAPYISELYERRDFDRLRRTYWMGVCVAVLVAIPGALVLFAIPEFAFGLFGADFATDSTVLILLVTSRLVQAMFGPVGLLLTVTGNQNKYLAVLSGVSLAQIGALVYSAKLYGAVGVAAVMFIGTLAWSGILFFVAVTLFPWFPFGTRSPQNQPE